MTAAAAPTAPVVPATEAERQAAALAVTARHRAQFTAPAEAAPAAPAPAAPVVKTHERPEGVPEKFFNKDTGVVDYKAWSAAHTALETQFHQSRQQPKVEAAPAPVVAKTPEQIAAEAATEAAKTPEQKAAEAAAKAAAAAAEAAKPDPAAVRTAAITAAQTEYAASGKLSDASYTALASAGYDRSMVDTYIAGQTAKVTAIRTAAHEGAENATNYEAMMTWAAKTLTPAEQTAYDVQVGTNDPAVIKAASAALYAKYKLVAPVEGERTQGGLPVATANTFASKAEMTAAMREPSKSVRGKTRYETEPAYQAEVQAKIKASRAAGINIFN